MSIIWAQRIRPSKTAIHAFGANGGHPCGSSLCGLVWRHPGEHWRVVGEIRCTCSLCAWKAYQRDLPHDPHSLPVPYTKHVYTRHKT